MLCQKSLGAIRDFFVVCGRRESLRPLRPFTVDFPIRGEHEETGREVYTVKRDVMGDKGLKLRNSWGKGMQWDKLHLYLRVGPVVLFQLDTDWSNRRFTLAVLNFKITNK